MEKLVELKNEELVALNGGIFEMLALEIAIDNAVRQYQIQTAINSCMGIF